MIEPVFFDLGNGTAVCADGRWRGWLCRRHPDGQFITVRKLPEATNPYGSMNPDLYVFQRREQEKE